MKNNKINLDNYLLTVEKPAQYLGNEINSVHKKDFKSHMCLFFPDIYEIGMSNLGFKLLYSVLNDLDNFYLERGFYPMRDMEDILQKNNLSLFSLESKTPLKDFDIIGFSLSYELSYVNVLKALTLSNIPQKSSERTEEDPIIMGGGTCMMNPEPMKTFFDIIVLGDGEEVLTKIANSFIQNKDKSKAEKLDAIKNLDGVYIPSLHDLEFKNNKDKKIKKAILQDLNHFDNYHKTIIPYIDIVHDRCSIEIQRGCSRGCRFCQAGIVYRPIRERTLEKNVALIDNMLTSTGYEEISLSSLSSSDYSQINPLLNHLQKNYAKDQLNISLPSLRMNPSSVEVAELISSGRKTGFTFAPEAGSQRMRDVINKGVNEQEILDTAVAAIKGGWTTLKFYFMIGLPFETEDDLKGILDLVEKVVTLCRPITKKFQINVSVSNFIPKPHTPFQWHKQITMQEMEEKHKYLREIFKGKKNLTLKLHKMESSYIEGFLSRGDKDIAHLIESVAKKELNNTSNKPSYKIWMETIKELNLNEDYYLGKRDLEEDLPWDKINILVDKSFLISELKKAEELTLTPDCRKVCSDCGVSKTFTNCHKD